MSDCLSEEQQTAAILLSLSRGDNEQPRKRKSRLLSHEANVKDERNASTNSQPRKYYAGRQLKRSTCAVQEQRSNKAFVAVNHRWRNYDVLMNICLPPEIQIDIGDIDEQNNAYYKNGRRMSANMAEKRRSAIEFLFVEVLSKQNCIECLT